MTAQQAQPAPLVLPWKRGQKVIELGGGANPAVRPNVDVRWLPQVDVIADLNWPIPLAGGEWDGVFSRYVLEHISWRKYCVLLGEMYRLLKPGGIAVIITANLEAQMRHLLYSPEWTDELICEVFGDQNYEGGLWWANAHHCGFSPAYITKLLKEAGFWKVEVQPLPGCSTDMAAFAYKGSAEVKVG